MRLHLDELNAQIEALQAMPQNKPRNPACTVAHIHICIYMHISTLPCFRPIIIIARHLAAPHTKLHLLNSIHRVSIGISDGCYWLVDGTHQFANTPVPAPLEHAHKCTPCTCMCPELYFIKIICALCSEPKLPVWSHCKREFSHRPPSCQPDVWIYIAHPSNWIYLYWVCDI